MNATDRVDAVRRRLAEPIETAPYTGSARDELEIQRGKCLIVYAAFTEDSVTPHRIMQRFRDTADIWYPEHGVGIYLIVPKGTPMWLLPRFGQYLYVKHGEPSVVSQFRFPTTRPNGDARAILKHASPTAETATRPKPAREADGRHRNRRSAERQP